MLLRSSRFATIVCLSLAAIPSAAGQQERDRDRIPDQYKWNLQDLYPSDDAWRAAKDKTVAEIPSMRPFKGTLGTRRRVSPTHSTSPRASTRTSRDSPRTSA